MVGIKLLNKITSQGILASAVIASGQSFDHSRICF